ncbi:hypothetical protein DRN73_01715 [Candidatus Pacearchaeota archaeon]|nr:MAG: hypothetical protein DRN73_01715 [Candidatus Pacearchaeota archaeon]
MTRKIDSNILYRLIISFLLATIVFLSIFFIANSFSYLSEQSIINKNDIILNDLDKAKLRLDNFVCDNQLLISSSEDLDDIGFKISILERRFGKKDSRVLEKKRLYSDLELMHLDLIKKFNINCNSNFTTLLFFYSNEERFIDESENTAFILSSFKSKNPSKIMIYSFDYDLDYDSVNELKLKYNISFVPSVLINEKDLIYLKNIMQLEKNEN